VLPTDVFADFEATCAETVPGETIFNALNGSVIAARPLPNFPAGSAFTVDRAMARKVFQKHLEDDMVWGKDFERYEIREEEVVAFFKDGSQAVGDLLVGADGWNSPVRKQLLPQHITLDTGACCVYGRTLMTPELLARFPAAALRRLTLVMDNTPIIDDMVNGDSPVTLLFKAMRFKQGNTQYQVPEDYVNWVLMFPSRLFASTDAELEYLLKRAPRELTLEITREWDPSLRSLLELQSTSPGTALKITTASPDQVSWPANPRVTLLGDAIHVMSPSGGLGASTALTDAAALSRILATDGLSVGSITKYEEAMRGYAGMSIRRSFKGGQKMFAQLPFDVCKRVLDQ
jgi:2-polyprenyl-6-methoxyphenol hydroxylase-like FAD-dependent oxidoreductase